MDINAIPLNDGNNHDELMQIRKRIAYEEMLLGALIKKINSKKAHISELYSDLNLIEDKTIKSYSIWE